MKGSYSLKRVLLRLLPVLFLVLSSQEVSPMIPQHYDCLNKARPRTALIDMANMEEEKLTAPCP